MAHGKRKLKRKVRKLTERVEALEAQVNPPQPSEAVSEAPASA